jgi:hypothetical protein
VSTSGKNCCALYLRASAAGGGESVSALMWALPAVKKALCEKERIVLNIREVLRRGVKRE